VHVEFSPEALSDLEEIAVFIARDSPSPAERWVDRLVDRAVAAGLAPRAGRVVPELQDSTVREVLLANYRIIYRVEARRVLVLTIIEGHRRLRRR
jgi:toxin ParE1/3/4